ncbi:MAG: lipopolysaccharide biosynthesis protein [Muribaculum sp.]|nr:lipopolysaccharide biosynthesis protein [Muribaculum sp.]
MPEAPSLKTATARTLKWNTIDRVSSQVVFALVGIVLANVLSKADFGLVGALAIFQAFAIIFVDSGFGAALLQKKEPADRDYSTVFWFNLAVSLVIYLILFLSAPAIASLFHDQRLIPLSKVMFLIFVVNGLAIVQTNRLMKSMQVKMIAVSNVCGLIVSGILGIWMALAGFGAWALVGQQLSLAVVKTGILWATGHWLPSAVFSMQSLREIWGVGLSVFSSSFLNTVCLNIYNFVIAWAYGIVPLGIYTQAEKWSKMGSASVSQILTASFVPVLARVQDNLSRFHDYMHRINRFTAFILFPFMIGLTAAGAPLFHTLFGTKWDEAIPLFQILMIRGVFVVLHSLYSNYLLSLGKSRALFAAEVVKDVSIAAALMATVFFGSMTILVWGQLAASLVAWAIVLGITCRACKVAMTGMLQDLLPYFLYSCVAAAVCMATAMLSDIPAVCLLLSLCTGFAIYIAAAAISKRPELREALEYLLGRYLHSKKS